MGNVTVLANQKSLSRRCTVLKKTRGFFCRQSYCECFLNRTCVQYINPAEQLLEKLKFLVPFASFYSRRKPTEISSKFSGHEKENFEFGPRNFGSRDAAYVYLSDTHHTQIIDWKRLVRHKSLWRTERLGPQTSKHCLANE